MAKENTPLPQLMPSEHHMVAWLVQTIVGLRCGLHKGANRTQTHFIVFDCGFDDASLPFVRLGLRVCGASRIYVASG